MGEVSRYSDLSREKEMEARRYEEDLRILAARQQTECDNLIESQTHEFERTQR
jgi:hypothetical protein